MSKLSFDQAPPTAVAEAHQQHTVRFAALGGMVFFGLAVVVTSLTSNFPAPSDSTHDFYSYLADHQGRLQTAAVLYALAMAAVLLFLSGLFRALRKAEGGTSGLAVAALAGGILAATSTVIGALVLGTAASRYVDLGPAGARVFSTMVLLSAGATLAGQMLVIGTTAAVCLQTHLFARWFAVVSVVLALASVVGVCAIGFDAIGVQIVAYIAGSFNAVWILLVSVFLWRRPELAAS